MRIDTKFDIGQKVNIDGCTDVVGTIVSLEIRPGTVYRYEVSWWNSGDCKFCTFDEFRLSAAPVSPVKFVYDDRGS